MSSSMPEILYNLKTVAQHILSRERLGARFSIVVAAEGARAVGASHTVLRQGSALAAERLGGIGERIATNLECLTNKEARSVVLGHLQRGGTPTSTDWLLATRFGARAMGTRDRAELGHDGRAPAAGSCRGPTRQGRRPHPALSRRIAIPFAPPVRLVFDSGISRLIATFEATGSRLALLWCGKSRARPNLFPPSHPNDRRDCYQVGAWRTIQQQAHSMRWR